MMIKLLIALLLAVVLGLPQLAGAAETLHFQFDFAPHRDAIIAAATGETAEAAGEEAELIHSGKFLVVPPGMKAEIKQVNLTAESVNLPINQPVNWSAYWNPAATGSDAEVLPSEPVAISKPLMMRGVQVVRLTANPLHRPPGEAAVRFTERLEVEVSFVPDLMASSGWTPRQYSRDFIEVISSLVENPAELSSYFRDDEPVRQGGYLVAAHQNAIPFIRPFVEWRRKSGWNVEILALSDADARNARTVKAAIQAVYDRALNAGVEPFDQLLLVGDRSSYTWPPGAGWILEAETGESIWTPPSHADYKYACLEGEDNLPDVGFARWCAGSQETLELFSGRTLGYESRPYLNNPQWFTRAAVFSQHWGNHPENAWDITIHTNVRWAREILREKRFTDIRFYEDYDYDQDGGQIGPWLRDQFNAGSNLMLGRAENLYWMVNFDNVNNRNIFPIYISLSGHGEYSAWSMLRNGNGQNLKGPVAATCGWGAPPTLPTSAVWLEMVNGLVQRGLSLGWARVLGITKPESYFPDFRVGGQQAYGHIKSDTDVYGDPGLRPWLVRPEVVRLDAPDSVVYRPGILRCRVTGANGGVEGALVTFYAPGQLPENPAEYAAYDDLQSWSALSDADGNARIQLPLGTELVGGTTLYITAVNEKIVPAFDEAWIVVAGVRVTLDSASFTEVTGNGDGLPHRGDLIEATITARNWGGARRDSLRAELKSGKFFHIAGDSILFFGPMDLGSSLASRDTLRFRIDQLASDAATVERSLTSIPIRFRDGGRSWDDALFVDVFAPLLTPDGESFRIEADGEMHELMIPIVNNGRASSPNFTATILSPGNDLMIETGRSSYAALGIGESRGGDNSFRLATKAHIIPGELIKAKLAIEDDAGFSDTLNVIIQAGEPSQNSPQGPDAYGYRAIDSRDDRWIAPEFEWIEIDPSANNPDFEGTRLGFDGQTPYDVGEAAMVELGFTTKFYGKEYDRITVTTNGCILPGDQAGMLNFQNWPLDRGIGGGAGIIAPFWARLKLVQGGGVFIYADEGNGMFVVEWSRMRSYPNGDFDQTFQVILRDPRRWALETGDPAITFQYLTIRNDAGEEDIGDRIPYASVGISSPDGKTGLNYSFRNSYPVTSTPLGARLTIEFAPSLRPHDGVVFGRVTDAGTGQPLDSAVVGTIYGLKTYANRDGRYLLSGVVADIPITMTAARLGFGSRHVVIDGMRQGDTIEVNIAIRRGESAPEDESPLPEEISLDPVFPNPFNAIARIGFTLPRGDRAKIAVFDLNGRLVEELASRSFPAGRHTLHWNGGDAPAGVYLIRLESGGRTFTTKAALVR